MINSKELLSYTKDMAILFAEDHDDLRENTTEILKNFFATVDSVANGLDALKLYNDKFLNNKSTYDLVIADIQMPKMNGVSLIEQIYEINPHQTVVVLSAHDESKYLLPLINLGIEQFIKKPIDYQDLLQSLLTISKKIKRSQIRHEEPNVMNIKFNATVQYDRDKKILFDKEENIYLTKYEIIFIQLLTKDVGKITSNEEIVEAYTLQAETMDAQNIRKLVSKLRKKLPKNCLESIYGIGYRFIPYFD